MFGGGANVTAVQLAGNPVASIVSINATQIIVVASSDSVGGQ